MKLTKQRNMKQFKLVINGNALTKQKMETSCKFLDELCTIEGVVVNPDALTINFNEDLEKQILTIAQKYGIVDLTEW